jgi:pyruvate/2-oxoglutarate dehydrogenase complex dihydrolipoamide dehydrogenase (E3) component
MSTHTRDDVIIIGTGQAGVPLATRLAAAGLRVRIIERGAAGGTCSNTGCTPTKTMIASARAAHVARTAHRLGVSTGDVAVDFSAVVARKNEMVARWRRGVERRLASGGDRLTFTRGHARFVAERTVEVAGERFQADRVVIDVGARAAIPAVGGLEAIPYLDSTRLLGLDQLPRHLLVLGGGYVGCELGQMMRRLGAEVTIVGEEPHILPHEDPDVSEALEMALRAEGIGLALGSGAVRVEIQPDADRNAPREAAAGEEAPRSPVARELALTLKSGEMVRGSHLLVATGRRPNTDDLGCVEGGVALDAGGHVRVDEHYQTSIPGVFAAGDCTDGPQFTHTAWDDHRVLFDVLTGRPARARSQRLVPFTVFTDPQVAGVGLSERQAHARKINADVATLPFGNIARAIETDETAGIVKVLVDPSSERILGARIVGADAGELIHVFLVLMQAGASVRSIVDAEFVHPTFAEGLQTAVMKLPRYSLS